MPARRVAKGYRADAIAKMAYKVKTEDDQPDENGVVRKETCKVCLWIIEKGNHYL